MVSTFTKDSSVEILHSEIPTLTSASGFDATFSLQFALREIPSLTSASGFDAHFGLLFTLRTSTLALVLDELFGLRFRFGGNFGGGQVAGDMMETWTIVCGFLVVLSTLSSAGHEPWKRYFAWLKFGISNGLDKN